jgi:AcrR family transcriptional regulator
MTKLTRKQHEIARRRNMIIAHARKILAREGYYALTMEKVAASLEYSRGTIYQHFKSKDEIIGEIGVGSHSLKVELFRRAKDFTGSLRERFFAAIIGYEHFTRFYSDYFLCDEIIRIPTVWNQLPQRCINSMMRLQWRMQGPMLKLISEAIELGELPKMPKEGPASLVLGLWSLVETHYSFLATKSPIYRIHDIHDGWKLCRSNTNNLLDGYGWKPLSTDHDYEAVYERLKKSVFSGEYASLPSVEWA